MTDVDVEGTSFVFALFTMNEGRFQYVLAKQGEADHRIFQKEKERQNFF